VVARPMRASTRRRGWLYSVSTVMAAVLIFLGFGVTVAPDLGTRLSGAGLLAGAGSYDEAIEEVDRGIREHPDQLDGFVFRAAILAQAGRYDEAILAYDRALAHETAVGNLARSLVQDRASVLLVLGRVAEVQAARDGLARDGVDRYVCTLDAVLAEHRKEWPAAVRHWEQAVKLEGGETLHGYLWTALMSQGQVAVASGRLDEARQVFARAAEVLPGEWESFMKGAEIRLAEGDPAGAMVALEACPENTPGVAPLMFRCATDFLGNGEADAAWDAVSKAVVADKSAVAILLSQEPIWKSDRDSARMKALFAKSSQ
jgi:tetratricopeptide (TPR) repeat protein